MKKALLFFLIIIAVLAVTVWVLGKSEPVEYKGEIIEPFDDEREVVWQVLTDVRRIPYIKNDVDQVSILEDNRGLVTWDEKLKRGGFRKFKTVEKRLPTKYVIELYESSYGLTGTWTYYLQKDKEDKVQVLVQEESRLENVWLRGLNKIRGRNVYLRDSLKSIRVGLFRNLIDSP